MKLEPRKAVDSAASKVVWKGVQKEMSSVGQSVEWARWWAD